MYSAVILLNVSQSLYIVCADTLCHSAFEVLRHRHSDSLEYLDLCYNNFAPRVLQWIFSIHIGSFRSLQELYLRQGIRCMVHQRVRKAIIESLERSRYHPLQSLDIFRWDRSIEHMLDINCVGRRVFQADSLPIGLWPLILERATCRMTLPKKQSAPVTDRRIAVRQASALYHMLRSAPSLLQKV